MLRCVMNRSIWARVVTKDQEVKMNPIATEMDSNSCEGAFGPVVYTALLNKGWERAFELSKASLELAVEHNAEALDSYKKSMRASGSLMFNLASKSLEGYVALQMELLSLAVRYLFIKAAQENGDESNNEKPAISNLSLKSVDCTIAVQRSILALSAKQTEAVREQPCSAPDEIVEDSAQLQADTLLAKEIVDLVVKQQPCINGVLGETDADIVQLRINTQRAKEGVEPVANPLKNTDPLVH